jgi:hypothetical protein
MPDQARRGALFRSSLVLHRIAALSVLVLTGISTQQLEQLVLEVTCVLLEVLVLHKLTVSFYPVVLALKAEARWVYFPAMELFLQGVSR